MAAKWHANAHWALGDNEAILCLGIAFDALLGSDDGPQRRELSERFALLHPKQLREDKYRLFSTKYYTARSAVAHGGSAPRDLEDCFSRSMSRDLRYATKRLLQYYEQCSDQGELDINELFCSLKWGRRPHNRATKKKGQLTRPRNIDYEPCGKLQP